MRYKYLHYICSVRSKQTKKIKIMYTIETVKIGLSGSGAYNTPNQTIKTESFDTIKEARKVLRLSLKNGYEKVYNNYYNSELNTEFHTNF